MIIRRAKEFSVNSKKVRKILGAGWKKYKSEMPALLSTGSLALSTAYFLQGRAKKKGDEEYQNRQIEAMNDLTNKLRSTSSALKNVNSSIDNIAKKEEPNKKGFFDRFKRSMNNKNNNK